MGCNQIFCLFLVSALCFCSANGGGEDAMVESADRVTLSVYYETLCPFCAHFIVNHLVKLFDKDLIDIVNLRMIPWGNAMIGSDGSVICQHGKEECLLNNIEACTITLYPDAEQQFGFIQCVESLMLEKKSNEWTNCFATAGLVQENSPIDCYKSGQAKEIEQKYANETANLSPPHTFVPWVVVNDLPLLDDYRNYISYICSAYKGNHIPDACRELPLDDDPFKQNAIN